MPLFHVFVYGTLKPGEQAYEQFCQPHVVAQRRAMAQGVLYSLPQGYPAMVVGDGWVAGYRLSFRDPQVLAAMDEFEDYFPQCPDASLYRRLLLPLQTPDQQPLDLGWTYVMTPQRVEQLGGVFLPEGHWSGMPEQLG